MRKVFLIGLVGLVSLAIVQPALAQRGGGGGFRGGGDFRGGGGFRHGGGSRTFFGFSFFLPLGAWYAPYPYYYPYPYSSYYPYSYPYSYYPAPPPAYSYVPPAPEVGYLRLEVEPGDTHIYVNGQYLGPVQQFAGGAATLAPGSYQVAVVAWGYRPFQQEVQIVVGQTSTIQVTLERDPAAPIPPPSPRPGTY